MRTSGDTINWTIKLDSFTLSTPVLPRILNTYKKFPRGSYTPKDLGVDMPKLKRIHVGYCVADHTHNRLMSYLLGCNGNKYSFVANGAIAHAHITDKYKGQVCFNDGKYLLLGPSEPTDSLWHEYAHVLADKIGHGREWQQQMRNLGKQPLVSADYIMVDQ